MKKHFIASYNVLNAINLISEYYPASRQYYENISSVFS